jgi:hypothetical protein
MKSRTQIYLSDKDRGVLEQYAHAWDATLSQAARAFLRTAIRHAKTDSMAPDARDGLATA